MGTKEKTEEKTSCFLLWCFVPRLLECHLICLSSVFHYLLKYKKVPNQQIVYSANRRSVFIKLRITGQPRVQTFPFNWILFFILMGATWMLQFWIRHLRSRIWFSLCLLLKSSLFTLLAHCYYNSTLITNVLSQNRNKNDGDPLNLPIFIDWILYTNNYY